MRNLFTLLNHRMLLILMLHFFLGLEMLLIERPLAMWQCHYRSDLRTIETLGIFRFVGDIFVVLLLSFGPGCEIMICSRIMLEIFVLFGVELLVEGINLWCWSVIERTIYDLSLGSAAVSMEMDVVGFVSSSLLHVNIELSSLCFQHHNGTRVALVVGPAVTGRCLHLWFFWFWACKQLPIVYLKVFSQIVLHPFIIFSHLEFFWWYVTLFRSVSVIFTEISNSLPLTLFERDHLWRW